MNIDDIKYDLDAMFSQAKQDKKDSDFYLRILIQAVLTHGKSGFLPIDYAKGEEAKIVAMSSTIEFGDGGVRIVYNK